MTDQEAYRRYTAKAENELGTIAVMSGDGAANTIAAAQVWATLALAAAQDRVIPADRPIGDTPQPRHVTDGEGDVWDRGADGHYYLGSARPDIQPVGYTLEMIAKAHDGYTEVT